MEQSFKPWLEIWTKPRATIEKIATECPKRSLALLSAIYGLPTLFSLSQTLGLSHSFSVPIIIIFSLAFSFLIGYIGIALSSVLLLFTGKWFGGTANYVKLQACVGWTNLPNILNIIVWFALIAAFGPDLFLPSFGMVPFPPSMTTFLNILFLVQSIGAVWSFVLLLKGISQVQQFGMWKSVFSVVSAFALIVVAAWLISYLQYST